MAGFMHRVSQKYNRELKSYNDLYLWSIENIGPFWAEIWEFSGVIAEKGFLEVSGMRSIVT
jgi:acetoacetyl-CoA synthetase